MAPIVAATPPPTLTLPMTAQTVAATSPDWGTYVVKAGDSLYTIAQRHKTSVSNLVSRNRLANGGRLIHPGQRLQVPGVGAAAPSAPAAPSATTTTYAVRGGDTLIGIAKQHRTTARALAALNKISVGGIIKVGQTLRVPNNGLAAAKAASSSTAPAPAPAAPAPAPATTATYTVRGGDTLIGIAKQHRTTARAIADLNKISVNGIIKVGQKLRVPTNGTSAAKAASTTAPAPASVPQPEMSTPFNSGGYSQRHFPSTTVAAARKNHEILASLPVPTREQAKAMIIETAKRHGVDPALALAISYQESGWNHRQVSVANAIGLMQVIPASGDWASTLIGREINLLDPQDNITAGVVIIRAHLRSTTDEDIAIAAYYQGMTSVRTKGMYSDTKAYVRTVKALRDRLG